MIQTRKCLFAACAAALAALGLSTAQAFELVDLDGEPKIVTVDNPNDPKYANAGDNLRNGVGSIFVEFVESDPFGFLCTASAIGPRHILTAAHCVYEYDADLEELWTVDRIRFFLSAGLDAPVIIEGTAFAYPELYSLTQPFFGAFAHGDIAVIELDEDLPADIETYELYTSPDEFGQDTRHYGHGAFGKGNKGATGGSSFLYARTGLNQYEQVLEPFLGTGIEDQLLHDFDSGGRKHNAMAWWFSTAIQCGPENTTNPPWAQDGQCTTFKDGNYPDYKGYGRYEIGIGPGDSGGPGFIDGKIAGVHSFGFTHLCAGVTNGTDFSCGLNSSYGEMSGDTRVAFWAPWVDAVVGGFIEVTPVGAEPEPVDAAAAATAAEAVAPIGKLFLENTYSATMRKQVQFSDLVAD